MASGMSSGYLRILARSFGNDKEKGYAWRKIDGYETYETRIPKPSPLLLLRFYRVLISRYLDELLDLAIELLQAGCQAEYFV